MITTPEGPEATALLQELLDRAHDPSLPVPARPASAVVREMVAQANDPIRTSIPLEALGLDLVVLLLGWSGLTLAEKASLTEEAYGHGFDARRRVLWYLESPYAIDEVWLHVLFHWHTDIDRDLPPEVAALATSPYKKALSAFALCWVEMTFQSMDTLARQAETLSVEAQEIFFTLTRDSREIHPQDLLAPAQQASQT